jgi:allene oxide cyclase-like protein
MRQWFTVAPSALDRRRREMKVGRTFFAALVGAAVVGTVVVATGSATSGGTEARTQTFTLLESNEVGSFSFVDNEPKSSRSPDSRMGPELSQGDVFTFTSELLTKTRKHAGWLHATCDVTFAAESFDGARGTCTGQFDLKGGQLAVSAMVDFGRNVQKIAIVGGTGAYEGVTGQIDSVNHENRPNIDTVRFHK